MHILEQKCRNPYKFGYLVLGALLCSRYFIRPHHHLFISILFCAKLSLEDFNFLLLARMIYYWRTIKHPPEWHPQPVSLYLLALCRKNKKAFKNSHLMLLPIKIFILNLREGAAIVKLLFVLLQIARIYCSLIRVMEKEKFNIRKMKENINFMFNIFFYLFYYSETVKLHKILNSLIRSPLPILRNPKFELFS